MMARGRAAARVDLWHGILWSKYKGRVFSDLHALAKDGPVDIRFYQISETRSDRAGTPVEHSYHAYPYELLFRGEYDRIPKPQLYWRVLVATLKSEADVILLGGFGRPEFWIQWSVALLRGKRVGVFCDSTLHDHRQAFLKSMLKRLFFAFCKVVFCYGERSAELARYYGAPASRVVQPVATASLPSSYRADEIVDIRRAAVSATPRFLFVGRLAREKNLHRLLQAFVGVRASLPDATLRIVGEGPEGQKLRSETVWLGLDDCVQFTGSKFDDDLYAEYAAATCLVLPSQSEPWGLVVNEALSYGCPVVVSPQCGCVPELVVEGETGFVTPNDDVERLAATLVRAATAFTDIEATAERCLDQVAPFTPARAARTIYEGCLAVTGEAPSAG